VRPDFQARLSRHRSLKAKPRRNFPMLSERSLQAHPHSDKPVDLGSSNATGAQSSQRNCKDEAQLQQSAGDNCATTKAVFAFAVLPLDRLKPHPQQPRTLPSDEADLVKEVGDLVASIKATGVILSPLLVRKSSSDLYEVLGGQRRYAAARIAGLHQVPCWIHEGDLSQRDSLRWIMHEQEFHKHLPTLDLSELISRVQRETGGTQEDVAAFLETSQSYVSDLLCLARAPAAIKQRVRQGKLSAKLAIRQQRTAEKRRKSDTQPIRTRRGTAPSKRNTRANSDTDPLAGKIVFRELSHPVSELGMVLLVAGDTQARPADDTLLWAVGKWFKFLEAKKAAPKGLRTDK
jgi:ParB/RepB/Spo0J family partition protein